MKRTVCLVLVFAMLFSLISVQATSVSASTVYASGDTLYTANADSVTNTVPAAFGTSSADGRVWTDKSVSARTDNKSFEITLSAKAQEYKYSADELSEVVGESATNVCDVLLIIDTSVSMDESFSSTTRIKAAASGLNEAINAIMKANSKNRIMVYTFSTVGKVKEVLPLASYGAYGSSTEYFTVDKNSTTLSVSGICAIGTNGEKGSEIKNSYSLDYATAMQYGIH